jgi:hypothetical protein
MGITPNIKDLAKILDNQEKILLKVLIKNEDTTIYRACNRQPGANADQMVVAVLNLEENNLISKTKRDPYKPGLTDQVLQHYSLTDLGKNVCYEARIH